jgi:hypothetical protein
VQHRPLLHDEDHVGQQHLLQLLVSQLLQGWRMCAGGGGGGACRGCQVI